MILFPLLAVGICVAAIFALREGWFQQDHRNSFSCDGDGWVGFGWFLAVLSVVTLLVPTLTGTGILVADDLRADKMELLLPRKETQREALISTVKYELSNDQYAQLISITDPNAFVVFVQGTAVSDFLIARTGQIVNLNAEIFALRNELDSARIDICNNLKNPFYPKLPFGNPDCEYDHGE